MDIPDIPLIACIDLHRPEDDVFLRSPGSPGPGPIAYPQHHGLVGSGASSEPSPGARAEAEILQNFTDHHGINVSHYIPLHPIKCPLKWDTMVNFTKIK
jgi:hypothetical protein